MRALIDTNILIDYLNGVPAARTELARYPVALISPISWMEVMAASRPSDSATVARFLARFTQAPITEDVQSLAVELHRTTRVRLPDAVIWATAHANDLLLVTRNNRDFPSDAPGVRQPYTLNDTDRLF